MKNLLQPDYATEILVAVTQDEDLKIFIDFEKLDPKVAIDVLIRAAGMVASRFGLRFTTG